MRIVFLIDDHAFLKPRLLETILLAFKSETVLVAGISRFKRDKNIKGNARLLSFWGLKGAISIFSVIATGRITELLGLSEAPTSLTRVCDEFDVPFVRVKNVNSPEFVQKIYDLEPDVVVSFQHQIFHDKMLEVAKVACLNCHPSDLPKYRGVMPLFWARLANEAQFAVTVHTMTKKIDEGRVVAKRFFPNLPGVSLLQHYRWAYTVAAETIIDGVEAIRNCRVDSFPEMASGSQYYKLPATQDRNDYLRRGLRIA